MMSQRKVLVVLAVTVALGLALVGYDAWTAYAQGPGGGEIPCGPYGPDMMDGWYGPNGYPNAGPRWNGRGGGMMGGGYGRSGYGMGMMGGMMGGGCPYADGAWGGGWNNYGPGMMGGNYGSGMMGGWTPSTRSTEVQTLEQAVEIAEDFIASWNDDNLALGEVMQFDNQFYGQAVEVDSGRGAFEFLIDPATGAIYPEYGPNMMWNLRYGMHSGQGWGMMPMWGVAGGEDGSTLNLSAEDAQAAAQAFLDEFYPGLTADEEADAFYGYYTLHILDDGQVVGMLSVNGYTGQVWLHSWHGEFVDMLHDGE